MPRNLRRKAAAPPVKAAKPLKPVTRRGSNSSSSLSLSDEDDDGYSAVDDISDSEDDDEDDVDAVEEKNIASQAAVKASDASRPRLIDGEDEEGGGEDADEDEEDNNDIDSGPDADETASWAGIVSEPEDELVSEFYQEASHFESDTTVERHVRFDIPSSESDSTETEDDYGEMFPDIFVSQNSLDPAFRREIESDSEESSASGTFWDYNGHADAQESETEEVVRHLSKEDAGPATPKPTRATASVIEFEQPQELDGYESDSDTTEDDVPEPIIRRKTRRRSDSMSELSDSDTDYPVASQRGQPRVGRFNLDRSDRKPIAVLNPLTRKMMIFTPHRRRQLDLSPEQFNINWPLEEQSSPILSNSANMMLSAMFSSNTFGDFVNTQAVGPTEAFFPFPSEATAVDDNSSIPSALDEEDDEVERKLNINDFISWDDHVREEGDSSGDEADESNWEPSSTPARPQTASSDRDVLSHLTSDTVGAFRRNQINQQLILSNQATHDSLAFSGPYNFTALRGLKADRFDTATAPLTPARRHKKHLSELTRSPLESLSSKRKASGGDAMSQDGHKRQRSISDVNFLRI